MKIAIIGSGISGLTAAYQLNPKHDISLFEKEDRIGGHTATKQIHLAGQDYAIDTGFIVYNDWTYPNFIKLMNELGVASQPTEMGFSVTAHQGDYEYSGAGLNGLFAQRKNICSLKHWKMLRDIIRFNREAIADLEAGTLDSEATLAQYLASNGYSQQFIDYYLVPMGCAIWSSSTDMMLDFPLQFFVRFFKNHGLLSVKNRPQWHVLKGGSSSYLDKLTASFNHNIHLNSDIASVSRHAQGATLTFADGQQQSFDQVIFACHSDQALQLLSDASEAEKAVLGDIHYKSNDVVLHYDDALLPKNKKTWSSWNYLLSQTQQEHAVLTYNMNILQGIESDKNFCVTLNASDQIDDSKVLGRYQYSHPVFTEAAIAAQQQWPSINGKQHTWFCGAYWANGFHEDGCSSGLRVAQALGAEPL
jgi:predicted NAD/FAD-binding protein